jgi:hypothetical protein
MQLNRHKRLTRRLAREDGISIAEVLIAALILTIGSLAVLNLVGAAARNVYRGEQSQVVSNRLQDEMERIKQLPYDEIALTGVPQDTSDLKDPRWRTQGTNFAVTQEGGSPQALVYDGSALVEGGSVTGGAIDPTPSSFVSGDVHGTVYRFVVWEDDSSCSEALCPGAQDLKRVIVAVRLDTTASGGPRPYQEVQSQLVDPEVKPADNENPPVPTDDAKPWTFFLTDTSCDNATRQSITGDHLTHNTDGACGAGLKDVDDCDVTGCAPGAPDLMFTEAPPLDPESPIYDYATDVEPPIDPDQDKGIQTLKPGTDGCLSSLFQPLTDINGTLLNDPDATRMQTIHKWVSPPMGTGFEVDLDGEGVLDLWTQSVNGVAYSARICIWLFERHLDANGVPVDTPAVNLDVGGATHFTYSRDPWPTTWTELQIPLNFDLGITLGPNSRLGLAISVERQGTSGGGMQFMYDEPSFDSRLEVKTHSALPNFE